MVLKLARDSVEHKLKNQISILVSNYEYYYAVGRVSRDITLAADETTPPAILKDVCDNALASYQPTDRSEQYLKEILLRYRPKDIYDEQMGELFLMGKNSI